MTQVSGDMTLGDMTLGRLNCKPIIYHYPFILLGGEQHCESKVHRILPKDTTLYPFQVSNPDLLTRSSVS